MSAVSPSAPIPSSTSPMWLTDEYAMSRFTSVWRSVMNAP